MKVASLERVSFFRDDRQILRDVSLEVAPGERLVIMGPNGAGKTTLVRLLAGLDPVASGRVERPPRIGYVPQAVAPSLFPWFSVLRNVALPRLVPGLSDAYDVARRLCERLLPGIDPRRRAEHLSGGEKQAAAIARALAAPGDLVLADEPLAALSIEAQRRARSVIGEELGARALVLVTHDPEDASSLCRSVLRLADGQLMATA